MNRSTMVVFGLLTLGAGTARAEDGEPIVVAAANVKADNADARAVSEALSLVHADVLVITECSRRSLLSETLATGGYRMLLEARDPSAWGICVAARIDGDVEAVPAPWTGPCVGPMAVGRFPVGGVNLAVVGVHLPPRVPVCEASTDGAVKALAALVKDGHLLADLGPARAGDAVIVAGDLNSERKKLEPLRAVGLAESGEVAGKTFKTWSAGPIQLWLDHVFAPAGWVVDSADAFAVPGSDHRGVSAGVIPR